MAVYEVGDPIFVNYVKDADGSILRRDGVVVEKKGSLRLVAFDKNAKGFKSYRAWLSIR